MIFSNIKEGSHFPNDPDLLPPSSGTISYHHLRKVAKQDLDDVDQ